MTDGERLHDVEQNLRCSGYLLHHRDADRDMAWLLDQLAQRDTGVENTAGSNQ